MSCPCLTAICPARLSLPSCLEFPQSQEEPQPSRLASSPAQQDAEPQASGEGSWAPSPGSEGRRDTAARLLQARWKVYRHKVRVLSRACCPLHQHRCTEAFSTCGSRFDMRAPCCTADMWESVGPSRRSGSHVTWGEGRQSSEGGWVPLGRRGSFPFQLSLKEEPFHLQTEKGSGLSRSLR